MLIHHDLRHNNAGPISKDINWGVTPFDDEAVTADHSYEKGKLPASPNPNH